MKFIDIIGSATSNMLRSKVRTLLTIIAIFIGAFTITLTVGISSGVSSYIDKQLGNIGAENVLLIQPKVEVSVGDGPQKYDPEKTNSQAAFNGPTLTDSDIDTIMSQEGISNVQPIVAVAPDYISGPNGEKYQINMQSFLDGSTFDLAAGSSPDNASDDNQMLLPIAYVDALGFGSAEEAVGKVVTIAISSPLQRQDSVTATISGVLQQSLLSVGGVSANSSLTKTLSGIQNDGLPSSIADRYFAISAQVGSGTTDEQLTDIKLSLSDKGYDAQTVEDQIGIIKQVIDAITYVLIFFGAIALLAASFGIINTLFMSVQERTKEIGLMKAMGMSRGKVFLLFSVEAILLGFWGSLVGVLAAVGVGQVANTIASDSFLKDLPGFSLTEFPLMPVLILMAAIMLIAFLAGTLPARRAARQDPIEALRYE